MDAKIRYKESEIVKELATELDLDKRVVEYIVQSQYKFVSSAMSSKDDSRPIRLPFFGVFTMKNKSKKSFYISEEDMKEAGFVLIASHSKEDGTGVVKVFRASIQVHQDVDEWYEIELSDKNYIEIFHFIQTDISEDILMDSPNYNGEAKTEIIYTGAIESIEELEKVLKREDVVT